MTQLNKTSFFNFTQPTILTCVVAGVAITLAVAYFSPLIGLIVGTAIVALLCSIRNWVYFSSLDMSEVGQTEPVFTALPWIVVAWFAGYLCVSMLSRSFDLPPMLHWSGLLAVGVLISVFSVWVPRQRRLDQLDDYTLLRTQKEAYRELRAQYYAVLGERRPPNWDASQLPPERIIELKLLEANAITALDAKIGQPKASQMMMNSQRLAILSVIGAALAEFLLNDLFEWVIRRGF